MIIWAALPASARPDIKEFKYNPDDGTWHTHHLGEVYRITHCQDYLTKKCKFGNQARSDSIRCIGICIEDLTNEEETDRPFNALRKEKYCLCVADPKAENARLGDGS